jgi:ArsR family metal-binding transcriptional regulator
LPSDRLGGKTLAVLLREYKFQLFAPKCNPSAEYVNCLAALRDDIREVFPYLNGRLKACQYNPDAPFLRFRHEGHVVALRPRQAAVSKLTDEEDARRVLDRVKDLINDTWEHRDQITPSERRAPNLTAIQLYRLLPGTNCGECGERTCLAFAVKLSVEEATLSHCSALLEPERVEKRSALVDALLSAGYDVPEDWL